MKNKCSILLLHFSLFYVPQAISQYSLTGKVREMKVYSISPPGDSLILSRKYFDQNGNVLEHSMYNLSGEIIKLAKNTFNKQNMITEEAEYEAANKLHGKITYKYNEASEVIEEIHYKTESEWKYKITSEFDNTGNKISEIKTDEKGVLMCRKQFTYDAGRNVTEEKNFDAKDSLNVSYWRKYDSRNNMLEERRHLRDKEQWRVVYTYNPSNKKESETHTYPFTKSNNSTVWRYDDRQRLIEEIIYDSRNTVLQKSTFVYLNNNLISESKNNSMTVYEYDSIGNKKKETISFDKSKMSEKYFDTNGNVLKWLHYNRCKLSYTEFFFYDSLTAGLIRNTKLDEMNIVLEENEYRYDDYGNLIEEVNKVKNGKILSRKAIVLTYY